MLLDNEKETAQAAQDAVSELIRHVEIRETDEGKEYIFDEEELRAACARVWDGYLLFEGEEFTTYTGLKYTYMITTLKSGKKGSEIYFSRKRKPLSRGAVLAGFRWFVRFAAEHEVTEVPVPVRGPKVLKVFGASYLYPIYERLGLAVLGVKKRNIKIRPRRAPKKPAPAEEKADE